MVHTTLSRINPVLLALSLPTRYRACQVATISAHYPNHISMDKCVYHARRYSIRILGNVRNARITSTSIQSGQHVLQS